MTARMYLLDRGTIQDLLNRTTSVRRNLNAAVSSGMDIAVSAITETQVRIMLTRHNPAALGLFGGILQHSVNLPWDSRCAGVYAAIDAKLPPGHGINPLDLWVAVHAIAVGATLVSSNKSVHLVPGILVRDWTV